MVGVNSIHKGVYVWRKANNLEYILKHGSGASILLGGNLFHWVKTYNVHKQMYLGLKICYDVTRFVPTHCIYRCQSQFQQNMNFSMSVL